MDVNYTDDHTRFSRVRQVVVKETISSSNNSKEDGCLPQGHCHLFCPECLPGRRLCSITGRGAELSPRVRPGAHLHPLWENQPGKWLCSYFNCGIPRAPSPPESAAKGFPIHLVKRLRVKWVHKGHVHNLRRAHLSTCMCTHSHMLTHKDLKYCGLSEGGFSQLWIFLSHR